MINKTLIYLHEQGLYAQKGLQPLPEDKRDFEFGSLFNIFGYTPKQEELELPTLSTKDQKRLENCVFQATTLSKETDEGKILSAQNLTARAYYNQLCGWGGLANLRNGCEALLKWGIAEQKSGENTHLDFGSYIAGGNMSSSDSEHKIKSYWRIKNSDEYLKAIDDGFKVILGLDWYSGYNQSGGFRSPWIINRTSGTFVGGHAVCGVGYKKGLAIIKNSYSSAWGDNARFYVDLDFLNSYIKKYGAFCHLDIEYNKIITAKDIIEKYEGKNVRGNKSGFIFRIQAGAKAYYSSDLAFLKINNFPYSAKNAFTIVPQEAIDAVPWYGGTLEKSRLMGDGQEITPWDFLKKPVNGNFTEDMDADKLTKNAIIIGEEDK